MSIDTPLFEPSEPLFRARPATPTTRLTFVFWILLGAIALAVAGVPAVTRTQEARVLETARQSIGTSWYGHVVPHVDGQLRLQKPPLAYWFAELSYAIFGVSTWAGRVPFVVAAWFTAGLTGHIARRLFTARAGLIATCATLGGLLVAHFGLLAETDVLTMLGVTAATYAYWRAIETVRARVENESASSAALRAHGVIWFHLGALATAFTLMAKGPPAIYPTLFLIAMSLTRRCPRALWSWLLCGAPITLLLGAVWYLFVIHDVGEKTFLHELQVAVEGGTHQASRVTYFGDLLIHSLPWTGALVFAVWAAAGRFRRDARLSGLLVWFLSIMIPLCIAAQRQRHYLLPAVPPLMLLTAWAIDRALRAESRPRAVMEAILRITTGALVLAGIALPIAGHVVRGFNTRGDWIFGALVAVGAIITLWIQHRRGTNETLPLTGFLFAASALVLQNGWASTLNLETTRPIARAIHADFGDRTVRLFNTRDLQLSFDLRAVSPPVETMEQLKAAVASDPRAIFVRIQDSKAGVDPPSPLTMTRSYKLGDEVVRVFESVQP